jgi:hypothetical protein
MTRFRATENLRRTRPTRMRRLAVLAGALATALVLAACGASTTSSKSYTGSKKGVAEAISSFQSDATALDGGKICKELLAAPVVERLTEKGATCERSIKSALEEVDTYTVTVEEIEVNGSSATAKVKSTVYGKEKAGTMSLVKEGGSWKVSDLS